MVFPGCVHSACCKLLLLKCIASLRYTKGKKPLYAALAADTLAMMANLSARAFDYLEKNWTLPNKRVDKDDAQDENQEGFNAESARNMPKRPTPAIVASHVGPVQDRLQRLRATVSELLDIKDEAKPTEGKDYERKQMMNVVRAASTLVEKRVWSDLGQEGRPLRRLFDNSDVGVEFVDAWRVGQAGLEPYLRTRYASQYRETDHPSVVALLASELAPTPSPPLDARNRWELARVKDETLPPFDAVLRPWRHLPPTPHAVPPPAPQQAPPAEGTPQPPSRIQQRRQALHKLFAHMYEHDTTRSARAARVRSTAAQPRGASGRFAASDPER